MDTLMKIHLQHTREAIEEKGIAKLHADTLEKRGISVDDCLNPSRHWKKIKYYDRINKGIKDKFKFHLAELPDEPIIKFTTEGYIGNGQKWDKLLSDFIKNPYTHVVTKEVEVAWSLIENLKQIHNGLVFLDSKFPLFGYMRDDESDEKKMPKSYLWQGEADAIACYDNKYTIVDFKVVSDIADYKENAVDLCGKHLHQCLVYARLLQLHMKLPYLPPVLIVAIHQVTGCELYPPLFLDYPQKCKDHIEELQWCVTQFTEKSTLNINKNENLFQDPYFEGTVPSNLRLRDLFKSQATVQDLLDAIDFKSLNIKASE